MDDSQASGLNGQVGCVPFPDMEDKVERAGLLSKDNVLSLSYPSDAHTENNLGLRYKYQSYQRKQKYDLKSWDHPEPV